MRVLIACEYSGRVRDAFTAAGHEAMSCDILPTESPGPHYQGDIRDVLYDGWDMLIAHPPCTRLANSGVRWLHERNLWDELDQALEFYTTLRDAPIKYRALENPIMHKYARERLGGTRRHVVQPWWFGDPAFKATGFELFNLPPLTPTDKLAVPAVGTDEHKAWSWIHRLPPSPLRWKLRSTTFPGIAAAMALQWGSIDA